MRIIRLSILTASSLILLSGCQFWGQKNATLVGSTTTDKVAPPPPPVMIPLPTSVGLPYVIYEDGGVSGTLIGCNDSLVTVPLAVPASITNWQGLLSWMYTELLAQTNKGTYETALPASGVTIQSLTTTASGAHVSLTGSFALGGVCDHPRITEQLKKVISQFPQFTTIKISMNGTGLAEYLSVK